ncbi:MAG: hypothetical protein CVV52_17975, partial [Spirochaetae bacterium HGW-Spirochaetae-8]
LMYEFGSGWHTDSLGFGPGPRYSYGTAVWTPHGEAGERLWVLGGMSNDGALDDVWQAQKRGVE